MAVGRGRERAAGGADGASFAALLRALRAEAAAMLVLRDDAVPDDVAAHAAEGGAAEGGTAEGGSADAPTEPPPAQVAFLVDRARWDAFAYAVAAEERARPAFRLTLTGPWPPYDFVRLQLGA